MTFDRRYDRWEQYKADRRRCEACMFDAPKDESCCKHHCRKYEKCKTCTAICRTGEKLCEKWLI